MNFTGKPLRAKRERIYLFSKGMNDQMRERLSIICVGSPAACTFLLREQPYIKAWCRISLNQQLAQVVLGFVDIIRVPNC